MHRSLSRTARALIMIAVMATGILLGYTTASQVGWVPWQRIPFQPLVREFILRPGATFAAGRPELYVITSSADVERIAADVLNLSQGQEDQRQPFIAALRAFDFSRHLGVFALSNQRSGCAQFTVRRVSQIQRTLVLHADISESGWACPAVITDPALVIVIDKQVIQSPITTVVLRNGWVDVARATVAP